MKDTLCPADAERVEAAKSHDHKWEAYGFIRDTDGGLVPTDWCRFCWQHFGVWVSQPLNGQPAIKVMPRGYNA